MRKLILHIVLLLSAVLTHPALWAQDSLYLGPVQFLKQVAQNHPVARQAELLTEFAAMQVREGRGAFDPKLYGNLDQKRYQDKDYWTIGDGGLKIPTRVGLELKAAYERNTGDFLNNQLILPEQGLAYFGASLPVLRGMFTDADRTGLRLSLIGREIAQQERRIVLNNLLLDALEAYTLWVLASEQLRVQSEGLAAAEFRFESIKNSYFVGDLAAIDTVEAGLQVGVRQSELLDAEQAFIQAGLVLQNYLWDENGDPMILPTVIEAPKLGDLFMALPALPDSLTSGALVVGVNHPEVLKQLGKIEQADRKRRLAVENLKPQLDIQYNFITEPTGSPDLEGTVQGFNSQDYKWGVRFSMPLFLRKERGKLQQSRIELEQAQLDLDRKQIEVINKYQNYVNTLTLAIRQVGVQSELTRSYLLMLEAEQEKFRVGESSLFLVNSRESKWIDGRLKQNKSNADLIKAWAGLIWASGGQLWDQVTR